MTSSGKREKSCSINSGGDESACELAINSEESSYNEGRVAGAKVDWAYSRYIRHNQHFLVGMGSP